MEASKILARIIGPLLIVSALGVFANLGSSQRLIEEFIKSPALCYLGGIMALIMGLLILQFHHKWEARWPVIITILGWLSVLKGVALILFPGSYATILHPSMASTTPLVISLGIYFIVGIFLTVKGYWGTD